MGTLDLVTSVVTTLVVVVFLAWLIREARSGKPERKAEEAARDHFTRTGRWPDE